MKYGDEDFLPLCITAQISNISLEAIFDHVMKNDITCYIRAKFATNKYEFKFDSEKSCIKVEVQREVIFDRIIINEFYRLDHDELSEVYQEDKVNLKKYEVARFYGEINYDKLPGKIEDEPYYVATNTFPYTRESVWVLKDAINFSEFESHTSNLNDNNCVDISNFPELLQTAIRMYQICWPLRDEKENRPIKSDFTDHLTLNLNFSAKMAESIWNIIHPKDDNDKKSKDKGFDFTKLDRFKQHKNLLDPLHP